LFFSAWFIGNMKASLLRLQHLSVALLVIVVLGNGCLHLDYSGANPRTLGLGRLQRDLTETRLMRARSKIVQNIIFGTGDDNDEQRNERAHIRT
jgi:hypothetical protein